MTQRLSTERKTLRRELKADKSTIEQRSTVSQFSAKSCATSNKTSRKRSPKTKRLGSTNTEADAHQLTVLQPTSTYDISTWIDLVRNKTPEELRKEYSSICSQTTQETKNATFTAFTKNFKKNRYGDIPVFDKTRVVLDQEGSYINASFVVNSAGKRYICAQAPKSTTNNDFWLMIWKENVTVIAMLCSCVEEGKIKSMQYWPSTHTEVMHLDKFKIQSLEPVSWPIGTDKVQMTHTQLLLSRTDLPDDIRTVYHIQYHDWPDRGMPDSEHTVCVFVERMRALGLKGRQKLEIALTKQTNKSTMSVCASAMLAPDLLHCSAGIGRTGTLCCILLCIDYMESTQMQKIPDIRDVLKHVRRQRNRAVQTLGQYLFIYSTLLEYINRKQLVSKPIVDELHFRDKAKQALILSKIVYQ